VRASTVDAYSYGFHSVVVEECTYDRSPLNHKVNLFDLHHKYADVMHVDRASQRTGTPQQRGLTRTSADPDLRVRLRGHGFDVMPQAANEVLTAAPA
jgi:hypothetical protein